MTHPKIERGHEEGYVRGESKEEVEKLEKDKKITEDDKFSGLELLQKIIDDYSKKIDEIAASKEKEILER